MAEPADPLSSLRGDHPRLLLTPDTLDALRARISDDATCARWHAHLRAEAAKLRGASPAPFDIPDGKRLLWTSRRVLDRVQTLAFVALADGDHAAAERAVVELESAAAFPHWNPSHFLDTAELARAFAVGLDWLHGFLEVERRRALIAALERHAFEPAMRAYDRPEWWVKADNNWNVVCHGGLTLAALAVAEDRPAFAARALAEARAHLPACLRHFAPDGGWPEGPLYWGYTARYLTAFLAGLESALGHDLGLGAAPGLARTGEFIRGITSPAGGALNYSDGGNAAVDTDALFYLAHRFGPIGLCAKRWATRTPTPQDLIWADPTTRDAALADAPPRDHRTAGVEVITLRSAAGEADARFVGVQAGANTVGHNRLDKGSFVYESRGVRWVGHLPADEYNQPEFFGKLRYHYYRNRAEAHNTVIIDPGLDPEHPPEAGGTITRFEPGETHGTAVYDLTPLHPPCASATRTFTLDRTDHPHAGLTVRDELAFADDAAHTLWWFAHTQQRVTVEGDGRAATLTHDDTGRTLRVVLLEPADATLTPMPAQPLPSSPHPEHQNPNDGTQPDGVHRKLGGPPVLLDPPNPKLAWRKLAVRWTAQRCTAIAVRFEG